MKTTELFCCTCDEWKKSNNQIIDAQLIANNHGFKYIGKVFKYCPWCGNKLYKEDEYKNIYLFIVPDKYNNCDNTFRYYPMSFLLESSDDFTNIIKKNYPNRKFPTISAVEIGCPGIYKCAIVIKDNCDFYIIDIKPINIKDCKCT
jgi:hypothetical protein